MADTPRDALVEIDGCFEAALSEGWIDAIENGNLETIRDIWYRRLAPAGMEARNALCAEPAPDALRDVLRNIVDAYDRFEREQLQLDEGVEPAIESARRYLAAPVPPADGAVVLQARNLKGGLWFEIDPEQLEWMAKHGHEVRALYPAELRSTPSPSPAGAAEPVSDERALELATKISTGDLASLPVQPTAKPP